MSIPERLRAERKGLKLTQSALANKIGVSRLLYLRFESGLRNPDALHLQNMREMGIDIWFVLTGQKQTPHLDSSKVDGTNNLTLKLVLEPGTKQDMGALSEVFQNSYHVSFTKIKD